MNLQEFINYRTHCPVCNNDRLILKFHSQRKQKIIQEEGRCNILLDASGYGFGSKYKVGYSIDYCLNDLKIEFYNEENIKYYEYAPSFLLERFGELHNNLRHFLFYVTCQQCEKYRYISNSFLPDLKACTIGDLKVEIESVVCAKKTSDNYRVVKLINSYRNNHSNLTCYNSSSIPKIGDMSPLAAESIYLPLIKIDSGYNISDRLYNLIVFS